MLLSRSLRRLVAGIAAVLLLACQGMAVARASSLAFPESSAGAVQESCHDVGRDAGKNTNDSTYQAQCQSQNASSALSKVGFFTATDLPALITGCVQPTHVAHGLTPVGPVLARAESPPLPIVLCRLRN